MESTFIYEAIGYLASLLVAVSLMMSRIVPLRVVNMLGAATFVVYGVLITSWPVAGMNAFIVLINIYYLVQIYGSKSVLKTLEMGPGEQYLKYFIKLYESDIRRYHPELGNAPAPGNFNLMVLRDTLPAGILLGHQEGEALHLQVDFVTPDFRDFKIGRFLYQQHQEHFRSKGIHRIVAGSENEEHAAYLRKMGFSPKGDQLELRL
jgi:GNAT superfamily N-acetyltransferase